MVARQVPPSAGTKARGKTQGAVPPALVGHSLEKRYGETAALRGAFRAARL
jgi:hypothetical protein